MVVFLIGLYVSSSMETSKDLFLAGKSLRWPAIGFSLFASNISSSTMIGLAGAAYTTGIAIANYEWMASAVLLFMALFCIPVFLKSNITTLPELLEKRYSRKSRLYYSGITILLSILVDTSGGLYAGALTLQLFFPSLEIWQTCVALAIFAGFYTAIGGLKAVVYTDFIQAIILLIGSIVLTYIVFDKIDFNWAQLTADLPEGHLSLIRPLSDPNMPWLGTFLGLPVLGFWYWSTNQYITQRILGAKNIEEARWGAVLGGFLKLIPLFTMVIPGVVAIQLFPNLENGDLVYPTLIKELLPTGLLGLVVAGLIAAIMSSVDSTLNSASTLVVHDFLITPKRQYSSSQTMFMSRASTLVFMIVAALWAPFIGDFGGLYFYLQQAFAILVPPVVVIYVMGLFTSRGCGETGFYTLLFGHLIGVLGFVANQKQWINIHFSILAGLATVLCFAFFLLISLNANPVSKDKTVRFSINDIKPSFPVSWYCDYRIWTGIVFSILISIVVCFW